MQTKRNLKVQGQDSKSYGKERHEVCYRSGNNLLAAALHFYLSKTNYKVVVSHLFSTLSFLLIMTSNISQVPSFSNDFIPIHAEK